MTASVSIAARDSLRGSTASRVSSQDRSFAVRNVHLPPTRTRLTPRGAYSVLQRSQRLLADRRPPAAARQRLLVERLAEANSSASSSRSSSGRACVACGVRLIVIENHTCLSAKLAMAFASFFIVVHCAVGSAVRVRLPFDRCALAHDRAARTAACCCISIVPSRTISSVAAKLDANTVARIAGSTTIGEQILVEPAPVGGRADQPLERLRALRRATTPCAARTAHAPSACFWRCTA